MSNYTYSSSSYSYSSSSSSANGQTTGHRYASQTQSDNSGTSVRTASQQAGQPVVTEERNYDASGRPVAGIQQGGGARGRIEGGRVEEIPEEKIREYEDRMEEEYAKREGGA